MMLMIFLTLSAFLFLISSSGVGTSSNGQQRIQKEDPLQNLVTWDQHSFLIRGERLMLYSGEFHPFRLPVPGLWLDIFQKIKAMGFNTVSFYTDWGLLEGNPGHVILEGIFNLDDFFDAAIETGIYLIARPGPYINAETAAGGFPGWTLRINGTLRSTSPDFVNATRNYVSTIGRKIAHAQITKGGPVILVQPENEYSSWPGVNSTLFPSPMNKEYIALVNQQYRDAGIDVPFINNDPLALGSFAPGTGLGAVDVYGIDAYPMRYDCAHPFVWPTYRWPQNWHTLHQTQSPATPFAIPEFQGGSATSWEGVNQDQCNGLVNEEAVRVFHKRIYGFGVKLLSIYMTYGGTNWGNLGFMGGDTSYDYGAAITENRHVWREKYSEIKLQANFFKVSPAYLTAVPGKTMNGLYSTSSDIAVTPLLDTKGQTKFYVVGQADFTSHNNTSYRLTIPTHFGNITVPQLGGQLTLFGRDAKIHVVDYSFGDTKLVYSTAEVFTWAKSASGKTILILYGGAGETHEIMLSTVGGPILPKNCEINVEKRGTAWVLQWRVITRRRIVAFDEDKLEIHIVWRNDAYTHWVLELPAPLPIGNYSSRSKSIVIVKGGYLIRSAEIFSNELRLIGDVNTTTEIEVVYEPTDKVTNLTFNGISLRPERSSAGTLKGMVKFGAPALVLPNFSKLRWKYLDSLPELWPSYDDSAWTPCNNTATTNPQKLATPISLYASDYGYHAGSLIYRGKFTANGMESIFHVTTAGGFAFGHSIWLNSTFLGSWSGRNEHLKYDQILAIRPKLQVGMPYVFTVLIDHMGQDEEAPGTDTIKAPLGILNYHLEGHSDSDVSWKMTGNLGGEQYRDLARGPRNEGSMYAERQGYHLSNPPTAEWIALSPIHNGLGTAGVGFFSTSFDLRVPVGYDVPMSFVFTNDTLTGNSTTSRNYRCQLFVNGYQFGKYVSNLGPQTSFPVPEGILNYNGTNYVGITLWALDAKGAKLGELNLVPEMPLWSGYRKPTLSPQPQWEKREGAY